MSWRTCIHEISHAIAARSLGQRVKHVRVFRDGSGTCGIDWSIDANFDWRDTLLVTVSGVCGERMLFGPTDFDTHEIKRARTWIESIRGLGPGTLQCVTEGQPEFVQAVNKADRLLRSQRGLVLQLARQLEREGLLTGSEIEAVATSRSPGVLRARLALEESGRCYP